MIPPQFFNLLLQHHNFPAIFITDVYVTGVVYNLTVGEAKPGKVLQELGHSQAESGVSLVTVFVVDQLLEHQFASLHFWFGYQRVHD